MCLYNILMKLTRFSSDGKKWKILLITIWIIVYGFIYMAHFDDYFWKSRPAYLYLRAPDPDDMKCNCTNRTLTKSFRSSQTSSCDNYATMRGGHQSVVSYTFYGDPKSPYFEGIKLNAELVKEKYPGWLVRIYHNLDITDNSVKSLLCPLWCQHHHLDFCQVDNLPSPSFNQSAVNPKSWRFSVLGDALVDRFMSRDLDSLISDREVAAVDQWLKSGKTWHLMHDHPSHYNPILGGMWGGLNHNLTLNTKLRKAIFKSRLNRKEIDDEQPVLVEVLLPIAETTGDYINHDSYHCGSTTNKSHPWPVQRQSRSEFVGAAILRRSASLPVNCPEKCRPPDHQDWTYC